MTLGSGRDGWGVTEPVGSAVVSAGSGAGGVFGRLVMERVLRKESEGEGIVQYRP